MTVTASHPIAHPTGSRRLPATAALVVLFWIAAAILVIAAQFEIVPGAPAAGAAAATGAIILAAGAYTWLTAPRGGTSHALGVGIAWLVLSITAEMVLTSRLGHGWFTLLGSPERPLLRNVFLFIWIFAPALFARRVSES
jgi:hypothetical protein